MYTSNISRVQVDILKNYERQVMPAFLLAAILIIAWLMPITVGIVEYVVSKHRSLSMAEELLGIGAQILSIVFFVAVGVYYDHHIHEQHGHVAIPFTIFYWVFGVIAIVLALAVMADAHENSSKES